ncbi:response regulator transcription factor [bacterium]|nr:response regulator transcription factor [bacterium]
MKHGLVVEDLEASAAWQADALKDAFEGIVVNVAGSIAGARRALDAQLPEIALIDLGLPDGDGVSLIRHIQDAQPNCICIVSTVFADDWHLFPALRAGARGYLLKDQTRAKVVAALHGIAAGEPALSPAITRRLMKVFSPDEPDTAARQNLSPRERETLGLIGKGLRLPEVAACLNVTKNTAAGYIKSVYRKLGISSRAEAAIEAARLGLIKPEL